LLANGKQFGLKHINYTYQEGEGGIADALALAEHFAEALLRAANLVAESRADGVELKVSAMEGAA
jgi:dTDP-glucose pyrophosphorylase